MPTKRTKHILALVVLLLLVFIAGYSVFFLFIQNSKQNIVETLEELSLQATREERLRETRSMLDDTRPERAQLMQYLVDTEETVEFIRSLELIAARTDISLEIESVKKEESAEVLDSVLFDLRTRGEWSDTAYFLTLLEALPFRTTLQDVFLEAAGEEERVWDATLTLRAFTRP